MATYSKVLLSGSTSGRGIKVAATATPGTTLHTAHATAYDEVWIYMVNSDTTARKVTVEFGGVTSPDDTIELTSLAPEAGLVLIVPGLLLTGALVVKGFAATTNVVMAFGYVNRIT